MSKLTVQFSELRKSTPKYVQWLLLGAAFVVVLILLTLLLTGSKNKTTKQKSKPTDEPISIRLITINANNEESAVGNIDWANTTVGTSRSETISVRTNAPTRVSMTQNKEIAGFTAQTTCTNATVINDKLFCNIYLSYTPTVAMLPETVTLSVHWRGENEPEEMKSAEKITVMLGATAPEIKTPAPVIEPEPVVEPDPLDDDFDDYYDDGSTIREEIESIAPNDPFTNAEPLPTPSVNLPNLEPAFQLPPESCSDFAFPGYGPNGTQIGWIKPDGGSYYFHPFPDKDCKNPTGIYNPNSGIITSINGNGNRIGSDAEHIGYVASAANGVLPALSDAPNSRRASARTTDVVADVPAGGMAKIVVKQPEPVTFGTTDVDAIVATQPYDRTFILRQYKPIPATIVSDVRADTALEDDNMHFPVRATVDRNVYSDNGRTVIIPTGTLLLGYVTGKIPGPYKAIGRMNIQWYQFVLPNGVEFNFGSGTEPSSADAQGRIGVPGRGSTDYLEQFVMPMLTAIVPAAVNMIAPVADKFVNQIDLDNNTVVQSGTLRSSELAKNEIITTWNQVAQKLLVDMMDNTVPPFSIPAGTRITVYSPYDLMVACTDSSKKCYMDNAAQRATNERQNPVPKIEFDYGDGSWIGQARSFNLGNLCQPRNTDGIIVAKNFEDVKEDLQKLGYSYSTLVAYCQASNYQAINNARQAAIYQNQQDPTNKNSIASKSQDTKTYNEQVLGLKYNADGSIKDPYQSEPKPAAETKTENIITCEDGLAPDANGCCTGEIYTDMGEQGFNCCPQSGGDCFPPIVY